MHLIAYIVNRLQSPQLWRTVLTKLGMCIGLVCWGFILWCELPDKLSYISILYGMAVQFWISCCVGVIVGYSHKQYNCKFHSRYNGGSGYDT